MKEFHLRENEDFIKLGQLLKAVNLVSSGVEAKIEIIEGNVKVNGEVCEMRGKKIHDGDKVEFREEEIQVLK
ncbi:RNA-binding S4 domain-containing protein [Lachnospiraceae bacterium C1.1]|nr:RNA-binding S4 domain-containing protein [Lachnospiraceae bacterium C1.1]